MSKHSRKIDSSIARKTATVVWFTGLSASGKSSTASAVEEKLVRMGFSVGQLDGDQVRLGLCSDLGFSPADRQENIRRITEVAKLMMRPGHIILVSAISPIRQDRQRARQLIGPQQFVEIYMNADLHHCEQRDPKGLYQKARAGLLKDFTGIDADYEPPENPELILNSAELSIDDASDAVITTLIKLGRLDGIKLPSSPIDPLNFLIFKRLLLNNS